MAAGAMNQWSLLVDNESFLDLSNGIVGCSMKNDVVKAASAQLAAHLMLFLDVFVQRFFSASKRFSPSASPLHVHADEGCSVTLFG
ncbi:MAG: hypothetical protein OEU92_23020 [Alphaproteobacteria bacterium]|nr:hypothetical protein [Alphaproteobacteria bacterium]